MSMNNNKINEFTQSHEGNNLENSEKKSRFFILKNGTEIEINTTFEDEDGFYINGKEVSQEEYEKLPDNVRMSCNINLLKKNILKKN